MLPQTALRPGRPRRPRPPAPGDPDLQQSRKNRQEVIPCLFSIHDKKETDFCVDSWLFFHPVTRTKSIIALFLVGYGRFREVPMKSGFFAGSAPDTKVHRAIKAFIL